VNGQYPTEVVGILTVVSPCSCAILRRDIRRYASAMMHDVGDPLVRAHDGVYRATWPERIRVSITPSAGKLFSWKDT
jgi:hypothetical protein